MTKIIHRHPLLVYVLLAYVITGLLWAPSIAASRGLLPVEVPAWASLPGNVGPSLAAVIVTASIGGMPALRDLIGRLGRWRVSLRWYAAALAPLAVNLVLLGLFGALSRSTPDLRITTLLFLLPNFLFWLTVGGPLGEELGWRGFALPRLLASYSPLPASLIVAAIWFGWHLPRYLVEGYIAGELIQIILFAIQVVILSILFTWLYDRTGGSLLLVVLFHASINSIGNIYPLLFPGVDTVTAATYFGLISAFLVVILGGWSLWAAGQLRRKPSYPPGDRIEKNTLFR